MRALVLAAFLFFLQACSTPHKLKTELDEKSQAYLSFRDYGPVSLSRGGSYLAVETIIDNQGIISIFDRKTMKPAATIPMDKNMKVAQFFWINDSRLFVRAVISEGYLNGKAGKGYLFAMDFNGKNRKQIYPKRKGSSVGSGLNLEFSVFNIIDDELIEKDGEKYALIMERSFSARSALIDLKLLNVKNGRIKFYDRVKMKNGDYGIDNKKRARIAYKVTEDLKNHFYTKNLKTNEWKKNNFWKTDTRSLDVIGFGKDNKIFYFLADNKKTLKALYSAQITEAGKVSKIKEIFSYKQGDILSYKWDKKASKVMYVEYGDGRPKRKYFSNSADAQFAKQIDKAFPGERAYLRKRTGDESLIAVRSDKRPSTYYIYNYKKKSVDEFLSTNEAVRPYPKVGSQVVEYKTRDGLKVRGYYYKAPGKKVAPLIMYIHGGPFGIFDRWGYSGDIQYMVSRGYSVMQINYRGSGGRGRAFEEKGYKRLGLEMQDDLADAALWAIKNNYAQKGKICLWGISYGAYASVMSTMKYPELFECGVGFGGAYDWSTIFEQGDSAGSRATENYIKKILPVSDAEKLKQSPVANADKLKKPIYILHGTDDVRCNILQARALKSALDDAKKQNLYKYIEYPGIGHWFASDTGQKQHAYNEVMTFMDQHLKK